MDYNLISPIYSGFKNVDSCWLMSYYPVHMKFTTIDYEAWLLWSKQGIPWSIQSFQQGVASGSSL